MNRDGLLQAISVTLLQTTLLAHHITLYLRTYEEDSILHYAHLETKRITLFLK